MAADAWSGITTRRSGSILASPSVSIYGRVRFGGPAVRVDARPDARSDLDRARISSLRIKVYQAGSRYDESVILVVDALKLFGVTFPDSDEDIRSATDSLEYRAVTANLCGRPISDLLDAAPELGGCS